jgi:hypothetical protein
MRPRKFQEHMKTLAKDVPEIEQEVIIDRDRLK